MRPTLYLASGEKHDAANNIYLDNDTPPHPTPSGPAPVLLPHVRNDASNCKSVKTDSNRTIRGFSTSAEEKLTGEPWFDVYESYWGSPTYADDFTSAACNGEGAFEDVEAVVRAEGCVKGAQ